MNRDLKTLLVIRDYLRERRDSPSTGSIVALMLGDEVERINKLIAKLEDKP
jgi:hypothetical protein